MLSCNYCNGDEAVFWKDNQNNVFVDSKGEMMVTANDQIIRFKVMRCPMCGRKLRASFLDIKEGDDIYYADLDNNEVEHGKIFSVAITDGMVLSFCVDFDCGDFDEFNGSALGVHYFLTEEDAKNAIERSSK